MPRSTIRVERDCLSCGTRFIGTPKATRCADCRAAGRKAKPSLEHLRKSQAKEAQAVAVPEPQPSADAEPATETVNDAPSNPDPLFRDPEDRRADQARRRKERQKEFMRWLNRRSRKPKGYPALLKDVAETPLGQLWVGLCHADGQVNAALRCKDVPEGDRLRLISLHFALRLKGHSAAALAKVCPKALLADPDLLPDTPDPTPTPDHDRQTLNKLLAL